MKKLHLQILIVVAALILFVPYLGSVRLFDWDEVNFAECAREMMASGDYMHMQIDFKPFYEKPPLFIWAQVACMKVFGVNEFAARLPNALIGALTLVIIFTIGSNLYSNKFGLLWVLTYAGSVLPNFYFHTGIIDPLFNLLIFCGIYYAIPGAHKSKYSLFLPGNFAGLAVLTKGPVGFGLIFLTITISWCFTRRQAPFPSKLLLITGLFTAGITMLWFGADYAVNGPQFITENLNYQWRLLTTGEAGHEQPWYYHPVVVLIGCFPASIFFFRGLFGSATETQDGRAMRVWMTVLYFVVLVVFSVVKTKIIHYSSMTYLPLTFLATVAAMRVIENVSEWRWWQSALLVFLGVVLTGLAVAVPLAFMNPDWMLQLATFKDVYLRSAIQQHVPWSGAEPFVGGIILTGVIFFFIKRRSSTQLAIAGLYGSVLCFATLMLPLLAPKIEPYTQGAALDFYQSKRDSNVIVQPLSMKSYAHLFYTNRTPQVSAGIVGDDREERTQWLLEGGSTLPTYFVCKVNEADQWRNVDYLTELYEKGGFVVFVRER
ncbi:MAG: glycosyltransferase family 39 protein [Ignavibacteria bacterium]|nr:glycosyltransferase family 39 protein [Ignavibacteria bacterium]